ncbi:MAG TPA: glycosyl hydrolase-related protein, partial [Candidatus Limnocylindrales bacterium]|nr:glycosyl hydrolase-related protein [Candidatus Limnocylindrales bacterium]
GLCGFVGKLSYERSQGLSRGIIDRTMWLLGKRAAAEGELVVFNPLGWARDAVVWPPKADAPVIIRGVPPMGYRVLHEDSPQESIPIVNVHEDEHSITLSRGALRVVIDKARGVITQIHAAKFPDGVLDTPLLELSMPRAGEQETWEPAGVLVTEVMGQPAVQVQRVTKSGESGVISVSLAPELDAVDIQFRFPGIPRPEPGFGGALRTRYAFAVPEMQLIHDHPYAVSEIEPRGTYLRKYPTGEWMTSPQWFEEVHQPFTALSLLDFTNEERGVLLLHDGSQAYLGHGNAVEQVLTLYDPWDEDYFVAELRASIRLVFHGGLTHAKRWRLAQEFGRPVRALEGSGPGGDLPTEFGAVWCDDPGVAVSALFRETEESGRGLNAYAGAGMDFPYVLRLVELNGQETTATIHLPGPVAAAFRTTLLGEAIGPLAVGAGTTQASAPAEWSAISLTLHPHEITTVYLDLVYGRKAPRNLDAYRHVWATVHRVDDEQVGEAEATRAE